MTRPGRVVAGIDEAGLGPLLGPMTLGFSAFRVPGGAATLHELLAHAVTSRVEPSGERLVVADSKQVFARTAEGHERLEATALAFLALAAEDGRGPESGLELLRALPETLRPEPALLERHPWYRLLPERLPVWVAEATLHEHVARLRAAADGAGVALLAAGARAVPAGELNASFSETRNKSLTHWRKSADVIEHLWSRFGADGLDLVVDRHGGRKFYHELLATGFPYTAVETASESDDVCEYVVRASGPAPRRMRISFEVRAEERSFAVALGSCLAKYVREICMGAFNRYFAGLQDGLKPTAGYRNDGNRWLADAEEAVRRADLPPRVLVRER